MFKEVPNYDLFLVTEKGIIKNKYTKNILKPYKDRHGYLKCTAKYHYETQRCFVHRLVALAFIPNPENKPVVNHLNSIRDDNRVENLEWCTVKENAEHASKYGNILKGDKSSLSVVSEKDVHDICRLLVDNKSTKYISDKFKVSSNLVDMIKRKSSWKHISDQYNFTGPKPNLDEQSVHNICSMLVQGKSDKEIISAFSNKNLTVGSLRFIKLRKSFKHITDNYEWE